MSHFALVELESLISALGIHYERPLEIIVFEKTSLIWFIFRLASQVSCQYSFPTKTANQAQRYGNSRFTMSFGKEHFISAEGEICLLQSPSVFAADYDSSTSTSTITSNAFFDHTTLSKHHRLFG